MAVLTTRGGGGGRLKMAQVQKKLIKSIPARTKTVEILWCNAYLKMSDTYKKARGKFRYKGFACWWCGHRFEDGEQMHLAAIKGTGNKNFCSGCATAVEEAPNV